MSHLTSEMFFLQIVGVDVSDEGVYTCFADNGRGVPPQAQVSS
jgi:hypothetical protein